MKGSGVASFLFCVLVSFAGIAGAASSSSQSEKVKTKAGDCMVTFRPAVKTAGASVREGLVLGEWSSKECRLVTGVNKTTPAGRYKFLLVRRGSEWAVAVTDSAGNVVTNMSPIAVELPSDLDKVHLNRAEAQVRPGSNSTFQATSGESGSGTTARCSCVYVTRCVDDAGFNGRRPKVCWEEQVCRCLPF